jgi:hypothetical protein
MQQTAAAESKYRSTYPGLPNMALYDELELVSHSLPVELRRMFEMRFGIGGEEPHTYVEIEERFGLKAGAARKRITLATRTLAQGKACLPTLAEVLGEDVEHWLIRATAQADHRGHPPTSAAEVRLLLALAGAPKRFVKKQATRRLEARTTRLLANVLWPCTTREFADVSAYSRQRSCTPGPWNHAGTFHSEKLGRDVHYDSTLERDIFLAFDASNQIASYQEQPITLDVQLPGRRSVYRPDAIALLRDGRAVMIELKPPSYLACYDHWLRWAELARWCHDNGTGLCIGSPSLSITGLYRRSLAPLHAADLAAAVSDGPMDREGRSRFMDEHAVTVRELAYAITNLRLDWNPRTQSIRAPSEGTETADAFWRLVARHASSQG